MESKKSSESRRKLLKSIAAGSGAIIVGKNLPESWSRPVVDSVILPAHAMTSGVGTHSGQTQQIVQLDTDSMFAEVIDALVPEAKAVDIGPGDPVTTVTYDHCITPNADRTAADIDIVVTWVTTNGIDTCTRNARYHLSNVLVEATLQTHVMQTVWYGCSTAPPNGFVGLTSLTGNAVGRFECGCNNLVSDFNLPVVACNLASAAVCDNCV